jgi:GH25 family lysozyme M1 (1,4-beta-N-acetylmuramidase)
MGVNLTKWVAMRRLAALIAFLSLCGPNAAGAGESEPWKDKSTALVIDAYEMNIIDWEKLVANRRVAAFISKASDGLPEVFDCSGPHNGDSVDHCKTMWRKYAVSRELYQTRKMLAKAKGLLWGAYHLARPGNPVDQANHFLDYARPEADELMVLDIEGLDSGRFMSLEDAQIFAGHIKARTGRYPVLYTNHATARYIAARRDQYRLLSRLPLWYARYRPEIARVFPMGNWDNYFLWQFSSASNCSKRNCPIRIDGTLSDIDVNTAGLSREDLARTWAQGELLPEKPPALQYLVSVSASLGTSALPGVDPMTTASVGRPMKPVETALNYEN